jgi:serine/threonine protein kinase/dipeptidyl aminopeptidase/acylaminoacyl peptidase
MSLAEGTQLGSYEVTGQLGAGGMGEVYRATDTKLGREVAIKTLPASLADDRDRLARFEREAKLLASLNHAHIASVYGLDEHEGTVYIAMELVEGETLEDKLKAGPLPVEEALQIGLQIAEALEAAHEKGVVHRDLKPANVMITGNGVVKVLDFGLAKAFSGDPNEANPARSPALSLAMTQQGLVLGTAGYMSPEQASGQATDQRADVWAFGVVLYEMLTGLPLFSGESVPHILADVLRSEPDWSRLPKRLHPRIRELLERCLEKKPRARYAGITDARADIVAALGDPNGAEAFPSTSPGAPRSRAARLASAAGLVAAGIAVTVAAGWLVWPSQEPAPVVRSVHALPDQRALLLPALRQIAISPDGRRYVYNAGEGLYVRRLDEFEDTLIPGTAEARLEPEFSPAGESLVFLSAPGTVGGALSNISIAKMSVLGGVITPLAELGSTGSVAIGLSWESDGTIVYSQPTGGISRISANGGEPTMVIAPVAGEIDWEPRLLPGGDWVLFTVTPGNNGIDVSDTQGKIVAESIATGERHVLRAGGSSARYVPTGHLVYIFGNTLYAVQLDLDAMDVVGGPVPVVPGVSRDGSTGIAQYDFSDDGTLIYVPGASVDTGGATLAVVDRDASIHAFPLQPGAYADARVSPDGKFAALTATYADGTDIAIYELGGDSSLRRLTYGGQSRYPVWSPDGVHVAFESTRDGSSGIYWQLADGTGGTPERLTTAEENETLVPDSFSPNGDLAYTVNSGNESSVWKLEPDTGESSLLLEQEGALVSNASFSPNGQWIAYQSTELGGSDVFVQPYPLTGAKYLVPQTTTVTNHHPVWSADGSEIFYYPGIALFESVRVRTEPTFSFGAVTPLNQNALNAAPATHRQLDVMPDGSGFFGAVPANAGGGGAVGTQIYIVQNWFDDLKRLAPTK